VCAGSGGTGALKRTEGLAATISRMLREELPATPVRRLLAAGLRGAFRDLRGRMDYAEYGGAPLLGVNGVCIVAHGRSSPYAIQHALRAAAEGLQHRVPDRLRDAIATL